MSACSHRRQFLPGKSLAGFDFVAGGEHGLLNPYAVQMSAVGAFLVDDAAALRPALHRKVQPRHARVIPRHELACPPGLPTVTLSPIFKPMAFPAIAPSCISSITGILPCSLSSALLLQPARRAHFRFPATHSVPRLLCCAVLFASWISLHASLDIKSLFSDRMQGERNRMSQLRSCPL